LLQAKLAYQPGERDLVVLHHRFGIETASGDPETLTSSLIVYGDAHGGAGGETAMARTVGLPTAIAADLILQGDVPRDKLLGVSVPTTPDMYVPLLRKLDQEAGLRFIDRKVSPYLAL
jgi:alpha-aminoadipic semialdehyde synthase